MTLGRWGDEWMDRGEGAPVEFFHQRCNRKSQPVITCSECGEALRPQHVTPMVGPALALHVDGVREGESSLPRFPLLDREKA